MLFLGYYLIYMWNNIEIIFIGCIVLVLYIYINFFLFRGRNKKRDKKRLNVSEKRLYDMIKRDYPDCIYQYKDKDILGRQSYDIYIPSKRIGIEYQGIQHFESVKYFGGREKYREQKRLDKRKRDISRDNGITLLYFTFDNKFNGRRLLGKKVYTDYERLRRRIRYNLIYRIFFIY